jgi:hypothetical protein
MGEDSSPTLLILIDELPVQLNMLVRWMDPDGNFIFFLKNKKI